MEFIAFILDQYANAIVGILLLVVIAIYFRSNPLRHSHWFTIRRFINWFPLGMTYSFLYMGRYNLNVSKNALGTLMTNQQFGTIFAVGTAVYAVSFLVNGPLVDKIGGKRGILIASIGASFANVLLGVLTYLRCAGQNANAHASPPIPRSTRSTCISRATARFPSSKSKPTGFMSANAACSARFSAR